MSKKAPKKAAKAKPAKKAPSASRKPAPTPGKGRAQKAVRAATRAARKPRNPPLPGLEHVRYEDLDAICEGVGDARKAKNTAIQAEQEYIADAVQAMRGHNLTVYKYAGVELLLVEGDAKVRARLIKDSEGEGADPFPQDASHHDAPDLDPDAGDVFD